MIRIESTQDRGRVVVATSDLEPGVNGLELLAETALLIVPPYDSNADKSPPLPRDLRTMDPNIWATYWCYKKQSEEVQAKVLLFYVELNCPKANIIRRLVSPIAKRENLDADEFVHVSMVFKFNAVAVNPASSDGRGAGINYGRGLFEIACRMSHSCKPNCFWISSQDGTKKLVRLIAPVQEGDEVTISYMESIVSPTPVRRQYLLDSKSFLCHCQRCSNTHDDTRCFPCPVRQCSGLVYVHQAQKEDKPTFLSCTKCNKAATNALQKRLLDEERALKQEIDQIEHICDHGLPIDVTGRIKKLRAPCTNHYLAEPCWKIQGELYTQLEQCDKAVKANEGVVACLDGILGEDYCDRRTAFALERLGDSCMALGATRIYLLKAETAYQRSLRILQITDGHSQPYTKTALEKLLSTQSRLISVPSKQGGAVPDKCALCGATAQKKCSGCGDKNPVFYCSREHQKAHWKLHKKQCDKKGLAK